MRYRTRCPPASRTSTFALHPESAGTTLTITEDGEVYNPVFRFVSRFILGHSRSIDRYLADAVRRFPDGGRE